jgi:hypothetical protein
MSTTQETREKGIGYNFTVKDQSDGYRQDDTLWFGTCTSCGERVNNSLHEGKWMHEEIIKVEYHPDGQLFYKESRQIDYCPKSEV